MAINKNIKTGRSAAPGTTYKLVGVIGGSGAGKSWFADRLKAALGRRAVRLSLDSFYRDRSHLSAGRRAKLNFDHPRAIDWLSFRRALDDLRAGRPAKIPVYDFASHTRLDSLTLLRPKPVVIVDGLWLACRPRLKRLFDLLIYVDCPTQLRLKRRLERDKETRGRTGDAVQEQFWATVEPMHVRFVEPQRASADVILRRCSPQQIAALAEKLR